MPGKGIFSFDPRQPIDIYLYMTSSRTHRSHRKHQRPPEAPQPDPERFEFFRNACALMPGPDDPRPGVASMVIDKKSLSDRRHCTCQSRNRTCSHLKALATLQRQFQKKNQGPDLDTGFKKSLWFHLARFFGENRPEPPTSVQMHDIRTKGASAVEVRNAARRLIAIYLSDGPDRLRFVERCGPPPADAGHVYIGKALDELSLLTLTETERQMLARGHQTRGLAFAQSFWYRLAYHGYREFGPSDPALRPGIDQADGTFSVTIYAPNDTPILRLPLPRKQVALFLDRFRNRCDADGGFCLEPVPVDAIFDVRINKELDLELLPRIRVLQKDGDFAFFGRKDLKKFEYGDLQYIPELGLMTHMEMPDDLVKRHQGAIMTVIDRARVPSFLDEFSEDLRQGGHRIDAGLSGLKVFKTLSGVEMHTRGVDRQALQVEVTYRFDTESVPLSEILQARKTGQQYIGTGQGWVDCQSPDLEGLALLDGLSVPASENGRSEPFAVSRTEVLRIRAAVDKDPEIHGRTDRRKLLRQIFEMTPPEPLPELSGRISTLRAYQNRGAEWLWYLYANGFGGLLCDDMGLGKTHQVMALMTCLKAKSTGPILVVCPTTVMSHWQTKIKDHAPELSAGLFHGPDRDLGRALETDAVLVTSYGILRRDAEALADVGFALAVFDEIQHLKNTGTQAHEAASRLRAGMKIGLTGTPIENSVRELKGLMDLVAPGYLGSDATFSRRYIQPIEEQKDPLRRRELTRVISPFVLRRRKATVLKELPAKIEDVRTCTLSPDQHRIYRQALEERRQGLLRKLRSPQGNVPYIHIFALLNRLKQICDHPALVTGEPEDYPKHGSGKWDLFTALLDTCLENGQKIVVYSQYLTMIDIIARHLRQSGVDAAVLTGASRNRGKIIQRFNTDPGCRVFVGSLMAGGTGIDLVAASVVIHYDRWWNAAREDQATDRVHRIGQTRGVQVFKLVTEETVEEKIAVIIDRKRALMDDVVREDDPNSLKFFTREELIEMLALPSKGALSWDL